MAVGQAWELAGKRICIGFGQDPGQAGKSQALHLVRALSGFTATPAPEGGDKLTRFGPFSSQCRAGNVKLWRGSWNEELFRVLEGFPDLAHDDEVDACSGALDMLNPQMKGWAVYELYRQQAEQLRAENERGRTPQPAPSIPELIPFAVAIARSALQRWREPDSNPRSHPTAASGT
jgi:hypothetical protein